MAPSNLHGLNIIHPAQSQSDSQDLLNGQAYSDLSAQLDLWTNLSFEPEEGPLGPRSDDAKYGRKLHDDEDDEARSPISGEKAIHDGHVNVVTGTNVGSNHPQPSHPAQPFDLNAFLAGFGIDPFAAAAAAAAPIPHPPAAVAPSLAQLLALHSNHGAPYPAPSLPTSHSSFPSATERPASFSHQSPSDDVYPPAKRSRTRKTSVSTIASPEEYREDTPGPNGQPTNLSAAEDKRRRNTAASARFRLKKKEREAALEGKSKELETRVNELERECEGLRRENGWLKGLVVGVTGAAQGPVASSNTTTASTMMVLPTSGSKRTRDEA